MKIFPFDTLGYIQYSLYRYIFTKQMIHTFIPFS